MRIVIIGLPKQVSIPTAVFHCVRKIATIFASMRIQKRTTSYSVTGEVQFNDSILTAKSATVKTLPSSHNTPSEK